jgi:DNA polymerase-3 subunit delta
VKGKALTDWVTSRCQTEHGKRIEYDAARHVVDLVGNSLGLLDGELEKLALYVGSRAVITRADAEALTGQHREQNVFGILAAMAEGDRASAMRQWEQTLQSDRTAEYKAIGGVAYGVRQLIAAHEALRSGESPFAVSRRVFCDEAQLRARLGWFTPKRLKTMLADLAEADLAAKSGRRKVQTSIETFIVEHSAPRGRSSR